MIENFLLTPMTSWLLLKETDEICEKISLFCTYYNFMSFKCKDIKNKWTEEVYDYSFLISQMFT